MYINPYTGPPIISHTEPVRYAITPCERAIPATSGLYRVNRYPRTVPMATRKQFGDSNITYRLRDTKIF